MRYLIPIASLFLLGVSGSVATEPPEPLVLYRIGQVPIELAGGDPVAVMLINAGGEEEPIPRYIVALAESRTVVDTRDLDLFRSVLQGIPTGTEVFRYDSCTVSRSWGLLEEQFAAYEAVFIQLDIRLSAETRITCYCTLDTNRP